MSFFLRVFAKLLPEAAPQLSIENIYSTSFVYVFDVNMFFPSEIREIFF